LSARIGAAIDERCAGRGVAGSSTSVAISAIAISSATP
jgi:hypothetical protein